MLIVGEHINTSRRRIAEAVEKQDAEFIVQVAKKQADAGADFIDVNAGTFVNREAEYLCWLVKTVQDAVDLPLCLDSPSPEALSEAVKHHRGEPMINSISLEKERFDDMLPIVTAQPCRVVALCMTETAMPVTIEDRVQAGAELIYRLTAAGVALGNIYIDPL
ncbi:MAG: dihydropteroate synthase, partial [Desulfobacterales bacterium]